MKKPHMKQFMSLIIIISLSNAITNKLYAQTPEIIWEQGFGGNYDDRAMDVIETPDGGYLTVGYTNSIDGDITLNHGTTDLWVIKTNSFGNMEWQRSYGGLDYDYGSVSYTHLRAHETVLDLVCRLLLEKKKQ